MAISINNNYAASVALQNLSSTQSQLDGTQKRISTGRKVDSAQDNAAIYAVAEISKGEVSAQKATYDVVNQGISLLAVTQDAGKKISDVLNRMLEKATAAQSATLTTNQRNALDAEFKQGIAEIGTIVTNANFNGTNVINSTATDVKVLIDAAGNQLTVTAQKLDAATLGVDAQAVDSVTNATTAAGKVRDAIASMAGKLGAIGAFATRLDNTASFTKALIDANDKAISNLVDADLAEESARLQSLQIKQQLGTQSLSIANKAPEILLSLFRN